jgi:hypothetical protein
MFEVWFSRLVLLYRGTMEKSEPEHDAFRPAGMAIGTDQAPLAQRWKEEPSAAQAHAPSLEQAAPAVWEPDEDPAAGAAGAGAAGAGAAGAGEAAAGGVPGLTGAGLAAGAAVAKLPGEAVGAGTEGSPASG